MRKSILFLLVGLLFFTQIPKTASAQSFSDVPKSFWAYDQVEWAASKGYVKGNNGLFKPNNHLTEGQFVSMLINYFKQTNVPAAKAGEHWAQPLYNRLKGYNLPLKGYQSDAIKNTIVTRGTVAKVLAAATKGELIDEATAVQFMFDTGLSIGRDGIKTIKSYGPEEPFTRGQACTILLRMETGKLNSLHTAKEKLKTKEEIVQQFNKTKATFTGNPFLQAPAIKAPYSTGKLQSGYIKDGENAINFYRYLADLPPVQASAELNTSAQHGSVLMAKMNAVQHGFAQPADMPNAFYQKAANSLSSANLQSFYSYEHTLRSVTRNDFNSLAYAVKRWIADAEQENYSDVGHRKWVLHPALSTVGFGMAINEKDRGYTSLQVTHAADSPFGREYVAHPNKGFYPNEYFSTRESWSLSLNPDIYQAPLEKNITISMKRLSDGQTWKLTSTDKNYLNSGEFLSVDSYTGYGGAYGITFHPGKHYRAYNGEYEVTVNGLKDLQGNHKNLSYTVNFFSLLDETMKPDTNEATAASPFARNKQAVYFVESGKVYELKGGVKKKIAEVPGANANEVAATEHDLFFKAYQGGITEVYKYNFLLGKVEKFPYDSFTVDKELSVSDQYVYLGDMRFLHDGSLYQENYYPTEYYYSEDDDEGRPQIYHIGKNDAPVQLTFDKTPGKSVPLKIGDWVYYQSSDSISRFNLKTKHIEELTDSEDPMFSYKYLDGKIYYIAYYTLYRMDLDGSNKEELVDYNVDDFAVYDNQLFVLKGNTYFSDALDRYVRETKAYRADMNGGNMIEL
ncbi:uncharacterized protein YkwD [Bacillus ectoiniformans]|uniref:S-layer homology domain-containing protein n=1 Tax=Bacillus ectoiniformans TaxID=1494429 RepID=UPI00195A8D0D|nr:S-layer homology domain-containing protein [Bacillus ectoiniformans]MBM7648448.1 uncharacterized protein YkwD [Bacillus ectoiniformans]